MRGVILCGGHGTRLHPATLVTNKHILPIYDKPMVYYPINNLVEAGVNEIMIITGKEHAGAFIDLLGDGRNFNASFTYRVQEEAGGIAHALDLCESFVGDNSVMVALGDNIFEKKFYFDEPYFDNDGAKIFIKKVPDPERFGVAIIDGDKISGIIEKPKDNISDFAVTGLYIYDNKVFDIIKNLKPSDRGELEITDLNNWYIDNNKMKYEILHGFWQDCGTPDGLLKASNFIKNL